MNVALEALENNETMVQEAKWRLLDADTRAYLTKLNNRTPEEIEAARARSTSGFPPPRPLPPGKTLEDVIVGALADDEDDAVIIAALKDMD